MGTLELVLKAVETLLRVAPTVITTIQDVRPYATALYTEFKGGTITPEEQDALDAGIDRLEERALKPLPPAQPGDPDYTKAP